MAGWMLAFFLFCSQSSLLIIIHSTMQVDSKQFVLIYANHLDISIDLPDPIPFLTPPIIIILPLSMTPLAGGQNGVSRSFPGCMKTSSCDQKNMVACVESVYNQSKIYVYLNVNPPVKASILLLLHNQRRAEQNSGIPVRRFHGSHRFQVFVRF